MTPTPSDLIFETFRKNLPLAEVYVTEKYMVYPGAKGYEPLAKKIIEEMGLPLDVSTTVATELFKRNLIITIKPSFYAIQHS